MMRLIHALKANYATVLYVLALALMLLALFKPQIQLKQDVHNYLLIADVSQSMNAEDAMLAGKPVSRMVYTRHLMKRIVETSPCGTYFSVGVFAAENVGLLFMPLEVCANYDIITDTINHLDWRMAWRGNSRLSFGVKSGETVLDSLNAPAQLVFFTDGDEAPKVNAINKLDLGAMDGSHWLFVGVGGHEPVPIPRFNSENKWVGFWPSDAKEFSAGAVGVTYNDTSKDEPDPIVAYAEFDRYLSQLEDGYLKELAGEIKAKYIEGKDEAGFYDYIQQQKPAAVFVTDYNIRWLYLGLALLLILGVYTPALMKTWQRYRQRPGRPVSSR